MAFERSSSSSSSSSSETMKFASMQPLRRRRSASLSFVGAQESSRSLCFSEDSPHWPQLAPDELLDVPALEMEHVQPCQRDAHDEEIVATLASMRESEDGAYDPSRRYTYRAEHLPANCDDPDAVVDERCRAKMLDWSFKMVDFFDIDRCVVSVAVSYQDRFLATAMGQAARRSREVFRIASVTCLYIAIKLYVPHKWNVTAQAFSQLCRGTISGHSIDDMELQVLFALGWNVNPPIPMAFADKYLHLLFTPPHQRQLCRSVTSDEEWINATKENILSLVRYQVSIVVQDVAFLRIRSSVIAAAALMNAIEGAMGESLTFSQFHSECTTATNGPLIASFFQDCLYLIRDVAECTNIANTEQLDEIRTSLLSTVMASLEKEDTTDLNSASVHSSADSSISHPPSPSPSPTSTVISTLPKDSQNDHLSPKCVLSRVCAMHFQSYS